MLDEGMNDGWMDEGREERFYGWMDEWLSRGMDSRWMNG